MMGYVSRENHQEPSRDKCGTRMLQLRNLSYRCRMRCCLPIETFALKGREADLTNLAPIAAPKLDLRN
jgi:hypothetical protein